MSFFIEPRGKIQKVGWIEDYNFGPESAQLGPKTKRGEDLKAIKMALLRYACLDRVRLVLEVLKSGPIETDVCASADVFARGLNELNALFHTRK